MKGIVARRFSLMVTTLALAGACVGMVGTSSASAAQGYCGEYTSRYAWNQVGAGYCTSVRWTGTYRNLLTGYNYSDAGSWVGGSMKSYSPPRPTKTESTGYSWEGRSW
jgi:hypothetical protein